MERGTFAIVLSFIAVFFGVVSIITSRPYMLDCDTTGVMVTILCCLVTVLIGWQIFNVIEINAIKKDTLNARDDVLLETNQNLVFTLHGLADFFAIQYANLSEDDTPDVKNSIYYGALSYRIMELHQAIRLNEIKLYNSSVKSLCALIDDGEFLSDKQIDELKESIDAIPNNFHTSDFIEVLNYFNRRIRL